MISNNDIIITPYIDFDVTIIFHSKGQEQEVQLDDIADIFVNSKTKKTMLTYYTGNPDCEHDTFAIDETMEDAKKTVKEAAQLLKEAILKYEIAEIQ